MMDDDVIVRLCDTTSLWRRLIVFKIPVKLLLKVGWDKQHYLIISRIKDTL